MISKSDERERVMHSIRDNIGFRIMQIMQMKLFNKFLNDFLIDIKLDWKNK